MGRGESKKRTERGLEWAWGSEKTGAPNEDIVQNHLT